VTAETAEATANPGAGRVWLVGAGPGDPELMTLRALHALETADVVLHDRLISAPILELIPTGVLRLDVGKLGYGRSVSQERINTLLVGFARAGHRVVRLKGGDPFVFGRGGEEAMVLAAAGVPYEVVPGVSAGSAVPAAAGIPVTHRGMARSVAFVTAESASSGDRDLQDWEALARLDTLVIFMAGAAVGRIASSLLAAGRSRATPVALIVDGTLPDMRTHTADLETLARGGPDLPAGRPCLMVVGEVVSLAPQISGGSGSSGPRRLRTAHAGRPAAA
jgi:uroporphyrin-III C-methyltransferase